MPYVPPARPSLRVIKEFTYRGETRRFGNRYFFNGGVPSSSAHWQTLADSATSHETNCYGSETSIVEAVGYDSGSDVPVWSGPYSIPGTYDHGSEVRMPGDCAGLVRISTDQRTSKNHPIYLYKYLRSLYRADGATVDTWSTFQSAHWKSVVDNWIAGLSDGTDAKTLCGPRGASGLTSVIEPLITHRDFPR